MNDLRKEMETAINRCCAENASNTPDFILAEFLAGCLASYDRAVQAREGWYGRPVSIISDWNRPELVPPVTDDFRQSE